MRKILCFLLIACMLLSVTGCQKEENIPENAVAVYYKKAAHDYGAEDGMIGKAHLDAAGHEKDYPYLIRAYLQSSPGEKFASTFPDGVKLVRFNLESSTAKVTLSSHMADCTGMDLTIALTCLTKTIMAMTCCKEVIFNATDTLLHGEKFVTLNADSFLLADTSGPEQN